MASQTYAIRTDTGSWFAQSTLQHDREPLAQCPLSVVCRIKISLETGGQSCITSFLGLSQETRQGPEGTLIRSRKQHRELTFSPTVKSTQASQSRPASLPAALASVSRPHAHLHQSQHDGSAGSTVPPEQAQPSFLPVTSRTSHLAQQSLFHRLSPKRLQHPKHWHCLMSPVLPRCPLPRYDDFMGDTGFRQRLLFSPWREQQQGQVVLNERKTAEPRHSWETPRGLAPCGLRSFFPK